MYIEILRGSHQKSRSISGESAISYKMCEQMRQKLNSGTVKFAQFLPLQLARVCEMRLSSSMLLAQTLLQLAHIYGMRHRKRVSKCNKKLVATHAYIWNETSILVLIAVFAPKLHLTHIYGMRRKKVTLHLFSEYMLHLTHIYGMRHALMPMSSYRKTHYTNTRELREIYICVLR